MGDYNDLRTRDIMSLNIYNFLENLLAAVHTSETLATEARELDQINVPNDIKPGGYPEGIFIFLSEREREDYMCSVCYSVIKDVHQCSNGHKFCYSCIYIWSTCNRAGADCCPACRCEGIYARNDQLNDRIVSKRVKCQDEGCNWRGFLRDYTEHEHRHYEFKELSRSVDLPGIKRNEYANIIKPASLLLPESSEIDKSAHERTPNYMETFPHSNSLPNIERSRFDYNNSINARSNVAPRRLARLPETPRIVGENIHPSIGQEGTGNQENSQPTQQLPSLLDAPREHRSQLLPPVILNRRNNVSTPSQPLDYRRLAPTYASRRRNHGLLHDGHEHLATILILLTSDLEDRVVQNNDSTSTGNVTASLNEGAPGRNRTIVYHGGSQFEDFRSVNSISEVTFSLTMFEENTNDRDNSSPSLRDIWNNRDDSHSSLEENGNSGGQDLPGSEDLGNIVEEALLSYVENANNRENGSPGISETWNTQGNSQSVLEENSDNRGQDLITNNEEEQSLAEDNLSSQRALSMSLTENNDSISCSTSNSSSSLDSSSDAEQ